MLPLSSRPAFWLVGVLLLTSIYSSGLCQSRRDSWSVTEFGAVGDGNALNTDSFQRAIDQAHSAGGGRVQIPAGTYLIGTLTLRSGVTLELSHDATLLGSPHLADYRRGTWPALIMAKDQENIGITGEGTIDGQGKRVAADSVRIFESGHFLEFFPGLKPGDRVFTGNYASNNLWIDPHAMEKAGTLQERVAPRSRKDMATWRVDEFVRPQLLEFWSCRNVKIEGVTLKNAANWVQTYRECDGVDITGIKVESVSYWNNDGLDIVNSRRVRIDRCEINAADDGICLKSEINPAGRDCDDIEITRCRIRSSASAIKFGTASYHGFRNIRISDIEVYDTYRSAVALESVDGATIENVTISRIRARNTGNALFLRIGQRHKKVPPGFLRNVVLSDIDVQVPAGKPDAGYEHAGPPTAAKVNLIPASIMGLSDRLIENVTLRNVTISYGGGGERTRAEIPIEKLSTVPEMRDSYPEFSAFGELPAWGFFIRHARGIRFENVRLTLDTPDFRSAVVADHVEDLTLDSIKIGPSGGEPLVVLANVSGENLANLTGPENATQSVRRINSSSPTSAK